MPDYTTKDLEYKTIQGDMWDIIAYREYGDEHAMNAVQDNNYDLRFTDGFTGGVIVDIPKTAHVEYNLKSGVQIPQISKLLPWR